MNFTLFKYFDCECDCSVKSEDYCFIVPVMLCGISFPMHFISEEKDRKREKKKNLSHQSDHRLIALKGQG